MTPGRVAGFLAGFAGVALLVGPEFLLGQSDAGGSLIGLLAVLGGAGANRVDAAARQEHRVARLHGDSVKTLSHPPGMNGALERGSRDAALQPDEQLRSGCGVGDVPHLGLGVAQVSHARWRMDLQ